LENRTNLPATMTPSWLARDMVALASIKHYEDVLEPSSGTGAIVREIIKNNPNVFITAVELNKDNYNLLVNEFPDVDIFNKDFLRHETFCTFNKIIMNPPHRNCINHINKAYDLLRPNGTIVALVHTVYLSEISTIFPDVRKYYCDSKTFVIEDNYIEAAIIVIDK